MKRRKVCPNACTGCGSDEVLCYLRSEGRPVACLCEACLGMLDELRERLGLFVEANR